MATIIDLGENRFIAGDPPENLPVGHHWCEWCGGDGLDYDINDELTICGGCSGACIVECADPNCDKHRTG
jgi:hypothetical protein